MGVLDRLKIVFEDASVIVVDKPEGLLTMATATERSKTAYALLREYLHTKKRPEKLFIVHRLDREASGLLVFAKTIEAKERLQDQFKTHSAGRKYIAVVEGHVKAKDFTIRSYLTENAAYRVYSTKNTRIGKLAITHVHVLRSTPRQHFSKSALKPAANIRSGCTSRKTAIRLSEIRITAAAPIRFGAWRCMEHISISGIPTPASSCNLIRHHRRSLSCRRGHRPRLQCPLLAF